MYVEANTRTFPKGETELAAYRRMKLTAGLLTYAGAADAMLGTLDQDALPEDVDGTVRLRTAIGTQQMVASGVIAANVAVYGATDGKVGTTNTNISVGTALTAATADGDVIEVLLD